MRNNIFRRNSSPLWEQEAFDGELWTHRMVVEAFKEGQELNPFGLLFYEDGEEMSNIWGHTHSAMMDMTFADFLVNPDEYFGKLHELNNEREAEDKELAQHKELWQVRETTTQGGVPRYQIWRADKTLWATSMLKEYADNMVALFNDVDFMNDVERDDKSGRFKRI